MATASAVWGGLSERAQQRAAAIADEADLRLGGVKGFWSWTEPVQRTPRSPEPGTWLRGHYRGREVRVQVRADGSSMTSGYTGHSARSRTPSPGRAGMAGCSSD